MCGGHLRECQVGVGRPQFYTQNQDLGSCVAIHAYVFMQLEWHNDIVVYWACSWLYLPLGELRIGTVGGGGGGGPARGTGPAAGGGSEAEEEGRVVCGGGGCG